MTFCAIWLKVCNFDKSSTPPWVFFTFFKLYKWYQIAQRITIVMHYKSLSLNYKRKQSWVFSKEFFCNFTKQLFLRTSMKECFLLYLITSFISRYQLLMAERNISKVNKIDNWKICEIISSEWYTPTIGMFRT